MLGGFTFEDVGGMWDWPVVLCVYVAEITPKNLRGAFTTVHQVAGELYISSLFGSVSVKTQLCSIKTSLLRKSNSFPCTHSHNMFNQNLVLSSFHSSSESGSGSGSASSASVPVDQQPVNTFVGKEVAVNGENENSDASGKQNFSNENRD